MSQYETNRSNELASGARITKIFVALIGSHLGRVVGAIKATREGTVARVLALTLAAMLLLGACQTRD